MENLSGVFRKIEIVLILKDGTRLIKEEDLKPYLNILNTDTIKSEISSIAEKVHALSDSNTKTVIAINSEDNKIVYLDSVALSFDSLKDKLPI